MAARRREDGRRANELRPVIIEVNALKFPAGSALIRAGDTHVLCAASVQEETPDFLRGSGTGWVTAEYDMLPSSTPTRKARRVPPAAPDGRSQEIRRLIGRSLRAAVDRARLGERTIVIDCDVLQADGGTRTLSITGAWVALALALRKLQAEGCIAANPLHTQIVAVSAGVCEGRCLLDLTYREDSQAEVDMNVVLTNRGEFVEIQGTAEGTPFREDRLQELLSLARAGARKLMRIQRESLVASRPRTTR